MEPGQEHAGHGWWVSFFSLPSLISPSSTHEPVLSKNSSQFPYLGLQSDFPVYIVENTHLPSADLKKKKNQNNYKTKHHYNKKLFLPLSPSQEHDDVPVCIICKNSDNQVSEADEALPYVQVT